MSELARRLGISQPSVSSWQRVPAERVLIVEQITGIARATLRPDLYPADAEIDEIDAMRAQHWGLLARLLARPPEAALLRQLSELEADDTALGAARGALAEAAAGADASAVVREFHDLFIGLGRGELLPYASYYLTGFLHERPLAKLRGEMARLGIARAEDVAEPEDHIASVAEIMAGLLRGGFGAGPEKSREDARAFMARHIQPWAGKFFADLASAEHARFYRAVGQLGGVFVAIETEAATLAA